jgi:hypothetical protein
MAETHDAHRAGTTGANGSVWLRIPLEDAAAAGNMGLEGYDEEGVDRYFPSAGLARAWVSRYRPGGAAEVVHGKVEAVRWEADGWDDETYGWVRDATAHVETVQYGYPGENGAPWHWDEPGPA